MPLAGSSAPLEELVTVDVSALVDLYTALCEWDHESQQLLRGDAGLEARVRVFWGGGPDQRASFDELLILAAVGGYLAPGATASAFVTALPELAARPLPPLRLASEEEVVREVVGQHLAALRDDPHLRARYVELLLAVIEFIRDYWMLLRSTLEHRAQQYRTRLEAGEDLRQLLPTGSLALKPRYQGLVDEGLRDGTILLVPTVGSSLIYDLPGVLLIGVKTEPDDPADAARHRTSRAAERLRALSDPTRLAVAAYLDTRPASVSGLARAFGLSQPTISAHIRSLRAAGLLEATRNGAMTEFRLSRRRIEELLELTREALFTDD